jgi:hypothetical protein
MIESVYFLGSRSDTGSIVDGVRYSGRDGRTLQVCGHADRASHAKIARRSRHYSPALRSARGTCSMTAGRPVGSPGWGLAPARHHRQRCWNVHMYCDRLSHRKAASGPGLDAKRRPGMASSPSVEPAATCFAVFDCISPYLLANLFEVHDKSRRPRKRLQGLWLGHLVAVSAVPMTRLINHLGSVSCAATDVAFHRTRQLRLRREGLRAHTSRH